jgi:DNA-binding MarR family transcriptional regulator
MEREMAGAQVPVRDFRKNLRVLEREFEISMASDTGCCGVSLAQCHLLLEVEGRERTSITELAGILDLDKSTLSRTVDTMCRGGLLDRKTDPLNRRHQIISLTGKGKARAESINGLCDASYTRLFDFIPVDKRSIVVDSIALLAGAMRQRRKSPDAPCCREETNA